MDRLANKEVRSRTDVTKDAVAAASAASDAAAVAFAAAVMFYLDSHKTIFI